MMERLTESQEAKAKQTRVRKRPLTMQLEAALREAADACRPGVDAGLRSLIQARLQILNQRLSREESGKLVKALKRIELLEAEIGRLQTETNLKSASPADDIRQVLKEYGGTNA